MVFFYTIKHVHVLISTIIICIDIDWKTSNEPRIEMKTTQFELTYHLTVSDLQLSIRLSPKTNYRELQVCSYPS
jgi:hypothetical protein